MPLPPLDTRGLGPTTRLRALIVDRQVAARNRRAEAALERIPQVAEAIREYSTKSDVTGASMSDYLTLYDEVRAKKPVEILEFGTGFSTVVLAHAALANAAEGAALARIRQRPLTSVISSTSTGCFWQISITSMTSRL